MLPGHSVVTQLLSCRVNPPDSKSPFTHLTSSIQCRSMSVNEQRNPLIVCLVFSSITMFVLPPKLPPPLLLHLLCCPCSGVIFIYFFPCSLSHLILVNFYFIPSHVSTVWSGYSWELGYFRLLKSIYWSVKSYRKCVCVNMAWPVQKSPCIRKFCVL